MNDISSVSNVLSSLLFADDTTLFYSSNNLQKLAATVNNELSNIKQWFMPTCFSFNIDKTNFMIFRTRGGAETQEVDSAKFLGIIIDDELNWLGHI